MVIQVPAPPIPMGFVQIIRAEPGKPYYSLKDAVALNDSCGGRIAIPREDLEIFADFIAISDDFDQWISLLEHNTSQITMMKRGGEINDVYLSWESDEGSSINCYWSGDESKQLIEETGRAIKEFSSFLYVRPEIDSATSELAGICLHDGNDEDSVLLTINEFLHVREFVISTHQDSYASSSGYEDQGEATVERKKDGQVWLFGSDRELSNRGMVRDICIWHPNYSSQEINYNDPRDEVNLLIQQMNMVARNFSLIEKD